MSWLNSIHFIRPWWFLALVPVLLVWLLIYITGRQGKAVWSRHCDKHLLPYVLNSAGTARHSLLRWLILFGWLMATVILAGPVWEKTDTPVYHPPQSRVIVMDLSPSMTSDDLKPSRLEWARLTAIDLLRRSRAVQNALVVFASDSYVVSPLTHDSNTILALIPSLHPDIMPTNGDNPYSGLQKAFQLLQQARREQSGQILLISDKARQKDIDYAAKLHHKGIVTSVLAVGNSADSKTRAHPYDFKSLKKLARAGGGVITEVSPSRKDVNTLLNAEDQIYNQQKLERAKAHGSIWKDRGYLLTLFLLGLAMWGFRRGLYGMLAVAAIPLGMLGMPQSVHADSALSWQALWSTPHQQGQRLLEQNKPLQAADTFHNPGWQGVAYYRAGDYQKAGKAFEKVEKPDSRTFYNRANTAVRLKQYKRAIELYKKAIRHDPDNTAAYKNMRLVEEFLKQQQQKQSQQSGKQKQSQQSGKQQRSDANNSKQQGQQQQPSAKQENRENQPRGTDSRNKRRNQQQQSGKQTTDASQQSGSKQTKRRNSDTDNRSDKNTAGQSTKGQSSKSKRQDSEQQASDHKQNQQQDKRSPSSEQQKSTRQARGDQQASGNPRSRNRASANQNSRPEQESGQQVSHSPQQPGKSNHNKAGKPALQTEDIPDHSKNRASASEPDSSIDHTSPLQKEKRQELEQWLRQVPDNPGPLLEREFRYQHRLRHR